MRLSTLDAKKQLLSPPGETILETIVNLGISRTELGERLGKSKAKTSDLINGKTAVTNETARKLEMVLGVSASFWLNLEKEYQEEIVEIEKLSFFETCKEWKKEFPIPHLKKLNFLPDTRDELLLSEALLKFFGIASPKEWEKIYCEESMSFKIELKHTATPQAVSTWLRIGELKARAINVSDFDKKKLKAQLHNIKKLAESPTENWLQELQNLCAGAGVFLCLVPSVPKAPIYGVARWINKKSTPLVQLTDRNKDYNSFWFSFYHELGHILLHNKSEVFLEGLDDIAQDDNKEQEADDFAKKHMNIPEQKIADLQKLNSISRDRKIEVVHSLAQEAGLHPSIIVSQLQRHDIIAYSDKAFNELKLRVEFEYVKDVNFS